MWVIASKTKTNRSWKEGKGCHYVWRLLYEDLKVDDNVQGWGHQELLSFFRCILLFCQRSPLLLLQIHCFNSYLVQKGLEDQIVLKPKWSLMRKRKKNSKFLSRFYLVFSVIVRFGLLRIFATTFFFHEVRDFTIDFERWDKNGTVSIKF